MNILLLMTVMCTLELVHGWQRVFHNQSSNFTPQCYNRRPCQKNYNNNAFNTFVKRHILLDWFNKSSKPEWERYLKKSGLCNRPLQSFIMKSNENRVLQICNGSGRRLRDNLCVSNFTIELYDVKVNTWDCKVERIAKGRKYLIVACDIIENRCCPVHFEGCQLNKPRGELCKPRV